MKDLATKINVKLFASAAKVDKAGGESLTIIGQAKATTTFTFLEGDVAAGTGATAVPADSLIVADGLGAKVGNVVTYSAVAVPRIAYTGDKRYLTVTVANPTTGATYFSISGDLHVNPAV